MVDGSQVTGPAEWDLSQDLVMVLDLSDQKDLRLKLKKLKKLKLILIEKKLYKILIFH